MLFCLDPNVTLKLYTLLLADVKNLLPYPKPSPNAHEKHPERGFWELLHILCLSLSSGHGVCL